MKVDSGEDVSMNAMPTIMADTKMKTCFAVNSFMFWACLYNRI